MWYGVGKNGKRVRHENKEVFIKAGVEPLTAEEFIKKYPDLSQGINTQPKPPPKPVQPVTEFDNYITKALTSLANVKKLPERLITPNLSNWEQSENARLQKLSEEAQKRIHPDSTQTPMEYYNENKNAGKKSPVVPIIQDTFNAATIPFAPAATGAMKIAQRSPTAAKAILAHQRAANMAAQGIEGGANATVNALIDNAEEDPNGITAMSIIPSTLAGAIPGTFTNMLGKSAGMNKVSELDKGIKALNTSNERAMSKGFGLDTDFDLHRALMNADTDLLKTIEKDRKLTPTTARTIQDAVANKAREETKFLAENLEIPASELESKINSEFLKRFNTKDEKNLNALQLANNTQPPLQITDETLNEILTKVGLKELPNNELKKLTLGELNEIMTKVGILEGQKKIPNLKGSNNSLQPFKPSSKVAPYFNTVEEPKALGYTPLGGAGATNRSTAQNAAGVNTAQNAVGAGTAPAQSTNTGAQNTVAPNQAASADEEAMFIESLMNQLSFFDKLKFIGKDGYIQAMGIPKPKYQKGLSDTENRKMVQDYEKAARQYDALTSKNSERYVEDLLLKPTNASYTKQMISGMEGARPPAGGVVKDVNRDDFAEDLKQIANMAYKNQEAHLSNPNIQIPEGFTMEDVAKLLDLRKTEKRAAALSKGADNKKFLDHLAKSLHTKLGGVIPPISINVTRENFREKESDKHNSNK